MKENQFDSVAPVYDTLVKLIFGKSLYKAQTHHLDIIEQGDKVLIVGGGTGQILKHKAFRKAESIDYVELSTKMIKRAQKHASGLHQVSFYQKDFFDHEGQYDLIVCNFFLDCLDEDHLTLAVRKLEEMLQPNGSLLVTDFRNTSNFSNRLLTSTMLLFFRVFSGLQAKTLHDIPKAIERKFVSDKMQEFKRGFIFSALYRPLN
ncbi:MAG: class I SAM-dependent methyltransferase [Cytophagia bacterium]|nr:class I SAM-dependent methyltransferase [Cytophagia bacterium]